MGVGGARGGGKKTAKHQVTLQGGNTSLLSYHVEVYLLSRGGSGRRSEDRGGEGRLQVLSSGGGGGGQLRGASVAGKEERYMLQRRVGKGEHTEEGVSNCG